MLCVSEVCLETQCLVDEFHGCLRAAIGALVAVPAMPVTVHHPHPLDFLFLEPRAAKPQGSEPNAVTDDVEVVEAFPAGQGRAHVDRSLHDAIGQVEIDLRVPVAFLGAAAYQGAAS